MCVEAYLVPTTGLDVGQHNIFLLSVPARISCDQRWALAALSPQHILMGRKVFVCLFHMLLLRTASYKCLTTTWKCWAPVPLAVASIAWVGHAVVPPTQQSPLRGPVGRHTGLSQQEQMRECVFVQWCVFMNAETQSSRSGLASVPQSSPWPASRAPCPLLQQLLGTGHRERRVCHLKPYGGHRRVALWYSARCKPLGKDVRVLFEQAAQFMNVRGGGRGQSRVKALRGTIYFYRI